MNNRYLKSALISSSIAVFAGVLFFGITATFGAPTYSPTQGDTVRPTFNGLNVTGPISNPGGALELDGNVSVTELSIKDTLTVNTDTSVDKPIALNGSTTIKYGLKLSSGDITMQGGSLKDSSGNVNVTGNLIVDGRVTASGSFGSVKQYTTTATIVPGANKSALITSSCNVGQMLLSCGVSISADGYVNTIYPLSFSCSANIYNQGLVNTVVKVYARCLDYAN